MLWISLGFRISDFVLPDRHRTPDGYVEADMSLSFPNLPMARLNEFLPIGLASGQSAAVRAMREWLRGSGPATAG